MTKEQLAEQLFIWAAKQKAMIPSEGMRKKFAQRLKLQILRLLDKDNVMEPTEPIRGGCVTTVKKTNKKAKNVATILTEIMSMKGDRNNPNA